MDNKNKKRYMVTLSDDEVVFLENEVKKIKLPAATVIRLMVNEARVTRKNQENVQLMFNKMKDLTPEQWEKIVKAQLSELEK